MPDLFVADEEKQPEPKKKPHPQKQEAPHHPGKKAHPASHHPPQVKPQTIAHQESQPVPTHKNIMSTLTTFTSKPEGVRFENQEEGEEIHLFLRRHFVTNLSWMITGVVLAFLPISLFFILPVFDSMFAIPPSYLFILLLFYYIIVFGYAFVNYVIWFYNIGIVTNLRVLDIDVSHITSKDVSSTEVKELIDVQYKQNNFLSQMFDFGDVHLQTKGILPNFEFHQVPHPAKVADIISDLMAGREVSHE